MFFRKKLLSPLEEQRLIRAIQEAELMTSGEIRVHIEHVCKEDPLTTCKKKFEELQMHKTKERNGILLYLAIKSKSFAVWGDEGIHQNVNDEFWENIKDCALTHFKSGNLLLGMETVVKLCGEKLKFYFPIQSDDKNELPNDITYN